MENIKNDNLKYLSINTSDEEWGIAVTTTGRQFIPPQGNYPSSTHPDKYNFKAQAGRILNEYQLVYITKGSGYFSSHSCSEKKVKAGTMIILFPDEWHNYYPDPNEGWDEYWVGFKGLYMDMQVQKHLFTKKEPLLQIGLDTSVVGLYEEIMNLSEQEKCGYQQLISGIVLHMLGTIYYHNRNNTYANSYITGKIDEARILMKENVERPLSPEEIAEKLGLGYSWFRKIFKEYIGISPTQYQLQQKFLRAKELLIGTTKNISEIASELYFENAGQFSTFFRKKEGVTPSEFRERTH